MISFFRRAGGSRSSMHYGVLCLLQRTTLVLFPLEMTQKCWYLAEAAVRQERAAQMKSSSSLPATFSSSTWEAAEIEHPSDSDEAETSPGHEEQGGPAVLATLLPISTPQSFLRVAVGTGGSTTWGPSAAPENANREEKDQDVDQDVGCAWSPHSVDHTSGDNHGEATTSVAGLQQQGGAGQTSSGRVQAGRMLPSSTAAPNYGSRSEEGEELQIAGDSSPMELSGVLFGEKRNSSGAALSSSICKNEICDYVISANPIAERLRQANAELARQKPKSSAISLQVLQWQTDCPCQMKRRPPSGPGEETRSGAEDSTGHHHNSRENATRNSTAVEQSGGREYCSWKSSLTSPTIFPADGDVLALAAAREVGAEPRELLQPKCVPTDSYDAEQEALLNRTEAGEKFVIVVDERRAVELARKYAEVIKRSPLGGDSLPRQNFISRLDRSDNKWVSWAARRHDTGHVYDPPYEDEKYYANSITSWDALHARRFQPNDNSSTDFHFAAQNTTIGSEERSWATMFRWAVNATDLARVVNESAALLERCTRMNDEYLDEMFHSASLPEIDRALELVRRTDDDLLFPTPWSLVGVAIYHVVSAILFTNAQLAGTKFLQRKGIDFFGGERVQMADAQKQWHNLTTDARPAVVAAAPLSFRMNECTGEGESGRMWDVAKEYAFKNAGRLPHGWKGWFGWSQREANATAVAKFEHALGPGRLPVLVVADVVDVTDRSEFQRENFRERFELLGAGLRGWWRRLFHTQMHMLMRCEKWSDRLNIRGILAVDEGDVAQVRDAVRAAVRLVANSRKLPSRAGNKKNTTADDFRNSTPQVETEMFGDHLEVVPGERPEPLKLVVMTVAEADKELSLFTNRGAKEWIPADLLAEWYTRHAIDFSTD
ncbi:unnamed protein product [Amoebophrya sp. A120]|nr:unnamed protein product [Amoebophrya sp. A120]|eukprot:GSA120T00010789001.1